MFLSLIPNMKGSVWDFEWMLLKLLNHIFKDFGRNLLSFDIMTMMMWRYWSVSNRVSVQFLGINMQEIMEIRDLSPPGSQKSCKFNQQISSMKKWKRRKKFLGQEYGNWQCMTHILWPEEYHRFDPHCTFDHCQPSFKCINLLRYGGNNLFVPANKEEEVYKIRDLNDRMFFG